MKLLYDQNLPPSLVASLRDIFPDSQHVRDLGLRDADDGTVWELARQHGFVICTKDSDFDDLSALFGPPPHVVWLRLGNCSTTRLIAALRTAAPGIHPAISAGNGVIEIYG